MCRKFYEFSSIFLFLQSFFSYIFSTIHDRLVIRKFKKMRKSTLLHLLFDLVNGKFSWVSQLKTWRPRTIPRSWPAASTSKSTLASMFSILIPKKIFQLHLEKFSTHFIKTMREGKYQENCKEISIVSVS